MAIPKSDVVLYDNHGRAVRPVDILRSKPIDKKAIGLFGNMYMFPEYGNFRPRFYTLSDTEQGLDSLSRELLVRWSREMFGQLSFVAVAANLKASFVVGSAYLPEYTGKKKAWGNRATEWLVNNFYPNSCVRGYAFDFQTVLHLLSFILEEDGDILHLFVKDEQNSPKVQLIPSHRIKSMTTGQVIKEGKFKDCVVQDGVVYRKDGRAVGFQVVEPQTITQLVTTVESMPLSANLFDTRNARLIFDPKFFDKNRGIPAISPAILQAISCQELYSYLQEKIKLESTVGLIEKNEAGEAPLEYANVLAALNQQTLDFGVFSNASPTTHGVQVIQGPSIRYVKATGGELTTLKSNSPPTETLDFIRNLETQILSTIGVPHQLIYSPSQISGRIVSGVTETFKARITERQMLLDKYAKLICGWACSVAIQNGWLPDNDENLTQVFNFTHPKAFTMDEGYDKIADLKDYEAGIISLEDIAKKRNTTAQEIIEQKSKETEAIISEAKRVSESTGVDFQTVLQVMKENLKQPQMAGSGDFGGGNQEQQTQGEE